MSILKNLKKKKGTLDVRKASQVIANINKAIEMGLLKVDLSSRKFSLQRELFSGRDIVFKSNWCRAVALYWDATTGQDSKSDVFTVLDIESGEEIGHFGYLIGFNSGDPANLPGIRKAVEDAIVKGAFIPTN